MVKFSSEIELRGHLIDSLILTKVFDGIMDHGGSFEVLEIKVGKKKKDESYAKLLVIGKNVKKSGNNLKLCLSSGCYIQKSKECKTCGCIKKHGDA